MASTLLLAATKSLRRPSATAAPLLLVRAFRSTAAGGGTGTGGAGDGPSTSAQGEGGPRQPSGRPRGRPPGSGGRGGRGGSDQADGNFAASRGRSGRPSFRGGGGGHYDSPSVPRTPAPLDEYGDTVPLPIINAAGEGAPGWQLLGEDPAIAAAWWAFDTTGGRAPGSEAAALLSEDAKAAMAAMAAAGASVPTLARAFGVRRQRVLAILALKRKEAALLDSGVPSCPGDPVHFVFNGGLDTAGVTRAALASVAARRERLAAARASGSKASEKGGGEKEEEVEGAGGEEQPAAPAADAAEAAVAAADAGTGAPAPAPGTADFVHGVWHADRLTAPGERHVVALPRYPRFQVLAAVEGGGAAAGGHATNEAEPEESDLPAAEAAAAAVQEARAVAEFEARLAYSHGAGAAGGLVTRGSTAGQASPRRPAGGWGLVVTPLDGGGAGRVGRRGKKAGASRGALAPYVAMPDGTTRAPSPAERLHLSRRVPLARKRIA